MKKNKHNHIRMQGMELILVLALLMGIVPGALAAEIMPTETAETIADATILTEPVESIEETIAEIVEPTAEATLPAVTLPEETAPAMNSDGNSAVDPLLEAAAAYVDKWHLNDGMTDQNMANLYFTFNSEESWDAWSTLNELKEQVLTLSIEDQNTLFQDTNAQLCRRFYDVMVQINTPVILEDITDETVKTGSEISISTTGASTTPEISDGIVSIQSTGTGTGCNDKKSTTVTITIKNTSTTDTATISFYYALSDGGSVTDAAGNALSGSSYSAQVGAGKTFSIKLVSPAGASSTNTLTLSNFNWAKVESKYNVTFVYDEKLGSLKVNGESVSSGETMSLTSAEMTMTSDADLVGWIDTETRKLLPGVLDSYSPTADIEIQAVLAGESGSAWFLVNGNQWYDDLNAASDEAAKIDNKTVVLAHGGTLPAGDYTIDSGVTLLIPFDDSNTLYTTVPGIETTGTEWIDLSSSWTKPTAYRTLTMASGANISVDGAISISGKQSAKQGYNGHPTGKVGFINMQEGSNITINNSANLYAWGYITGSGTVTAKNGATVYEDFQVTDWRGGTAASKMLKNTQKVFPLTQYYVQNVEVPLTLEYGAKELGYISVIASKKLGKTSIPFIGDGSMFIISEGSSITKDYDETKDRLCVDIDGNLTMGSLLIEVSGMSINSKDYVLPITNNLTVKVTSGTTEVSQSMAILPGAEIVVGEEAFFNLSTGTSLYVYDADNWNTHKFVYSARDFSPIKFAPGKKYTRVAADLVDAKVMVNGIADVSSGYIYTTTGGTTDGANICSTGNGKITIGTCKTDQITYQATQSGTDITYANISLTPAKLKHGNGTYLATGDADQGAVTYYYHATHQKWVKGEHRPVSSVVTDPTCTEQGYTTYTCACGYVYKDTYVDANGHSYDNGVITTQPTCTDVGVKTFTCAACGDTYTEEVAANGHKPGAAANCTDAQTCTVCGTELTAALGHTPGTPVITDEVLPTYKTDGSHVSTVNCSVCGEKLSSESVTIPKVVQLNAYAASAAAEVYLEMKFFLPEEMADGTIHLSHPVTKNGEATNDGQTYNVSDLTPDSSGRYVISHGIASGEMTCPVIVTFKDGNTTYRVRTGSTDVITDNASCAVTDYAKLVLDKGSDAQKELITSLVTYGGYAQKLFNVDAENPAFNILTKVPSLEGVTQDSISNTASDVSSSGSSIGIRKNKQQAFLDSAIYHEVYFTLDEGYSIDDFTFILTYPVNHKEYTKTLTPIYDAANDRYDITIEDIPAAYLDYDYKITVTNTETNETYTVTTSVLAYLKSILNSTAATAETKNQAKAMYLYNQAANTYFGK